MSHSVVVERHIQLANFYELRFEDRTLPEIVEQAGWLPFVQRTGYASKNLVREFYASILQARDLEEPSMEVTIRNVQIIFSPDELALFLGYVRDVTAFPNVPMTEEGHPTKAEAARARREEPAQGTEEQDLGQGSSQGLEGQRPSWVASMMIELTEQMRAVMQPTHEMVGNISSRLSALELKVVSMDAELKKQVSEVQLALKSVATSAELVALTERVVLLEEHMSDVGREHLEEMRRESPINVDRRHEEEFPLWFRNRDDFQLDYDRAEDRFTVTSTMNTAYRTHRNRMFQHYLVFNSKEEELEHPYPDMNKEEWTCVCDLFASEEFQKNPESDEISPALLYKKHILIRMACGHQKMHEKILKKWKCYSCTRVRGKVIHKVEIFTEVLGTKAGYVRGLGRSVRSIGSSSSVSSVDLSQRLEEARLEIEEMRARQLEYEALLVKRSDMEQTMREHLQMMEEQQRKKDEELMQMMAEQ
ncbi:hypothetical protein CJ030_MR4G028702 [Morella rubra]|uniref:Uncharacterized protein n=1 Tax=Morella rubra TaxID=262757 RepID=A0A6A1VWJ6_9ROSI|nr:hypothetical protein CJ030_MR4G028702 [Morella rubra]